MGNHGDGHRPAPVCVLGAQGGPRRRFQGPGRGIPPPRARKWPQEARRSPREGTRHRDEPGRRPDRHEPREGQKRAGGQGRKRNLCLPPTFAALPERTQRRPDNETKRQRGPRRWMRTGRRLTEDCSRAVAAPPTRRSPPGARAQRFSAQMSARNGSPGQPPAGGQRRHNERRRVAGRGMEHLFAKAGFNDLKCPAEAARYERAGAGAFHFVKPVRRFCETDAE